MRTNRSDCVPLSPGQLHLWTLRTDNLDDSAIAARVIEILSADERNEARRFRRAGDQHQFVIVRALARLALSSYFPVAAGGTAWQSRQKKDVGHPPGSSYVRSVSK